MVEIEKFANMTKLELTDEEAVTLSAKAAQLIENFAALDAVETAAAPLVTVLPITNVLREDTAAKFITREKLLQTAPDARDGYFVVPRTV